MRITDLLKKEGVDLNARVADKQQAIDRLVKLMEQTGSLRDPAA